MMHKVDSWFDIFSIAYLCYLFPYVLYLIMIIYRNLLTWHLTIMGTESKFSSHILTRLHACDNICAMATNICFHFLKFVGAATRWACIHNASISVLCLPADDGGRVCSIKLFFSNAPKHTLRLTAKLICRSYQLHGEQLPWELQPSVLLPLHVF